MAQRLLAPTPFPGSQHIYQLWTISEIPVGLTKGRNILFLYKPNCIDTPAIIWGTHWIGGIISPENPDHTSDMLAFQLNDARDKALITQRSFFKVLCEAKKRVGIPKEKIILVTEDKDETRKFKHFNDIKDMSEIM